MRVNAIIAALATLIVSTVPALSLESTMTVSSPLSPDELWKKVGDFCGLAAWSPAIESCFLSEDGKQRTVMFLAESAKVSQRWRIGTTANAATRTRTCRDCCRLQTITPPSA